MGSSPAGYQLNLQAEVTEEADLRVSAAAGRRERGRRAGSPRSRRRSPTWASAPRRPPSPTPSRRGCASSVRSPAAARARSSAQVVTCVDPVDRGRRRRAGRRARDPGQAAGAFAQRLHRDRRAGRDPGRQHRVGHADGGPGRRAGRGDEVRRPAPEADAGAASARELLEQLDCTVATKSTKKPPRGRSPRAPSSRRSPAAASHADGQARRAGSSAPASRSARAERAPGTTKGRHLAALRRWS